MNFRTNRSTTDRSLSNRVRVRRSWSAAVVACFGLFFVSAGVGLTATAANAAPPAKVVVCHATNSDTNPYTYILVDRSSTRFEAHLAHRNSPQQIWKKGTWFQDTWHAAGTAKPDLIDGLGVTITEADCAGAGTGVRTASASISILQQPACRNKGVGTWQASAMGATVDPASGQGGSGDSISATATALDGYQFGHGQKTRTLTGAFGTYDPLDCGGAPDPDPVEIQDPVLVQSHPACDNSGAWSWSIKGDHVTFSPAASASGTYAERANADTTVTAIADKGFEFPDGSTQKVISVDYNFAYAPEGKLIDAFGSCYSDETVPPSVTTVTTSVVVTQPTCQNGGIGTWRVATPISTLEDEIPAAVTAVPGLSGSGAPGSAWSVALSPAGGFAFPDGFKTQFAGIFEEIPLLENQVWNAQTHTCDTVTPPTEPPVDETPGEEPTEESPVDGPVKEPVVLAPAPAAPAVKPAHEQVQAPVRGDATVIPTLVKAGLPGTPAASATAPTSSIGSTLTGVGLMLLAMAGGIAFIGRRRERV